MFCSCLQGFLQLFVVILKLFEVDWQFFVLVFGVGCSYFVFLLQLFAIVLHMFPVV